MTIPAWLAQLLVREIENPIANDPRTVANPGTYLGWAKDRIFTEVIGFGQANFDQAIDHLSGADRALLYTKYNQPRHLDELFVAFTQLLANSSRVNRPTLIDIGCGPCTAGLALAAALGNDRSFRYYGIDSARTMRNLGQHLFTAAQTCGGIHRESSSWFGSTLAAANFGQISGNLSLIVASYLFASNTLDVDQLSNDIFNALQRIGPGDAAVLYTNSALPDLNEKFPAFQTRLEADYFALIRDQTVRFEDTKKPKKIRYALFFRKAITRLSL